MTQSSDGRNLDSRIADATGEGATFQVGTPGDAWPVPPELDLDTARRDVADTYYDLPVIKAAPWKGYIPAYFFAGGLAGAAATLAAAAELVRDHRSARRLHWIAAVGDAVGAGLLIADLGRPSRFHYMLRVFRPTSPLNMGTWILSVAGTSSGLALLRRRRKGIGIATIAGALSGSMLSTYTGVLIGNTAVPIWQAARRRLPLWFAASSAASLASLLEVMGTSRRRYSIASKTAELVGAYAVERAAKDAVVAAPLREGRSGTMWRASKWLGVASLAATVLRRPRLAGVLGTAAALVGRFAIIEAGRASATDPRATFVPQRHETPSP